MINNIHDEVVKIYKILESKGFEVFLVGGCVRDILMNRDVKDWDLATNATPDQIQSLFEETFYENAFGTVGIPYEHTLSDESNLYHTKYAEVTTYRTESGYANKRHPDEVVWGNSIYDDLSRRDFTMNAIAASIKNTKLEFIDPFEGQKAIENKTIVTVGNPLERFDEDALRIMRAIRFSSQLGFKIEKNTWNAIVEFKDNIKHVSWERIRDELLKTLSGKYYFQGVTLLNKSGILDIILPEIAKGKGISQVRPGRHHTTDVFTHNMLSLKYCPSSDPIVRLATLLHDVGKPFVASVDSQGHIIFYNHEVKGAHIAKEISDRLRLSRIQRDKIFTLIRWHMFTIDENVTDSAVRRFIRNVGLDNVKDILDLRVGDRLGSGAKLDSWRFKRFRKRIEEALNPPFSIKDLAIDGHDIMNELKIGPGKKVGEILKTIFEEVDEDLSKNTKEFLLKRIRQIV